jgi:hypothetical protein
LTAEPPSPDTISAGRSRAPRPDPGTAPSVKSPATPLLAILAHKMSPKIPASSTPIASATAMQPSDIDSIAARVDFGEDQDSGVARSSRAGTNRKVNARPASRGCAGRNGRAPRIHTLRRPFLRRMVVMVAVATWERLSMILVSLMARDPLGRRRFYPERSGPHSGLSSRREK